MKRTIIQLVVSVLALTVLTTHNTSAASIYDEVYKTTDTLSLSNVSNGPTGACSPVDYSTNWPELFDQASNPYSSQQTTLDNLKASFTVAQQSGRWGVSGFGDSTHSGIQIYWTEDTELSLEWQSSGVVRASGYGVKTISFVTQALWLGNSNCEPWARFALETYPPYISSENGYTKNYLIRTDYPNYPTGYEGEDIAGIEPITGNVQCANDENIISHVGINIPSSVGGNAIISNDGIGGKNYYYYLPAKNIPYSLTVICDGDAFYGPTVDTNFYSHYYWVCAPSTPGQNPNLRICAAS